VVAQSGSAGPATGAFAQLAADLESGGAQVEASGTVAQVFFVPEGQIITVNAQDVQVFEYATEDEAASASSLISPDGGSIGTTMVTWIASPHFYHKGKLIVLYVGEEATVLDALQGALGSQIAGR
jgi:hypothetical protein